MKSALISTRDVGKKEHSYTDVLLSGLAPDGGLYIPANYSKFSKEELELLARNPVYTNICTAVKQKLISDAVPAEDIQKFVEDAYTSTVFALEKNEVTPVREIGKGVYMCNLSLGPTASFKDMAMQMLGREMNYELNRRNEALTILGATSGDTGSAAEAAFKDLEHITLYMLSPEIGMSTFQKAQMASLSGGNIYNISIRGRFDDCQDLVKEIKGNKDFEHLGAVNSINWGRISSQVPYYFSAYFQTAQRVGDEIDFVIPSGNFGNAFSCYVAKQMGLPVRRIIIATNENDVLDRLIKTGIYEVTPAKITSSPSMDISKASNYERLAFDLLGRDAEKLSAYMKEFSRTGRVSLAEYGVTPDVFAERGFVSGISTHADRLATIKRVYEETKTIIDPHTADGVYVAQTIRIESDIPMVCMETALSVKFEDTIQDALGFLPPRPPRFIGLEENAPVDAFSTIDSSAEQLKAILRGHSN